jgi:hypothetical protein
MQAFNTLRAQHDPPAQQALQQARTLFQQGNPDGGYAKSQEIIDHHYAASCYRTVKHWLAERK